MQYIIDFVINNKMVVIFIFILAICIIIGYFGNKRLELKKKNIASDDYSKKNQGLQSTQTTDTNLSVHVNSSETDNKIIDSTFDNDTNNLIINESEKNFDENSILFTDLDDDMDDIKYEDQENVKVRANDSTITSNFFIPDDNNISNIF